VILSIWRFGTMLTAALAAGAVLDAGAVSAAQWRWPLSGQPAIVRRFDPPATPYGAGHRGVDLAGRQGLPVWAAGAGTVGYAGVLAGRGVVTVLHDGGLRTTYEPVTVSVHPGERVAAGAALGHLDAGHPGCTSCLHWGLLRGETYLDPLALLGIGRVRLLPLPESPPGTGQLGAAAVVLTAAGALPVMWHGARRNRASRQALRQVSRRVSRRELRRR